MPDNERLSDWYLFFSEVGVPDAESCALRALDLGYPSPPKQTEFAATIRSEPIGAKSLTDFFDKHGEKSDGELGGWIGFARTVLTRYRAIANSLKAGQR